MINETFMLKEKGKKHILKLQTLFLSLGINDIYKRQSIVNLGGKQTWLLDLSSMVANHNGLPLIK